MEDLIFSQNDLLEEPTPEVPEVKTRFAPKSPFWRSLSFFIIHCLLTPAARLRCLVRMRHTVREHKRLRGHKRTGYFLYGNHVDVPDPEGIPLALCHAKHTYRVVPSKEKNGRTVISPWRLLCGDIPTPAAAGDTREFLEAVEKRVVERGAVVIYPEQLADNPIIPDPYSYPARFTEPAFCFTTVTETNQKGEPCVVTYLDGPFYPRYGLPLEEQTADIRTRIEAARAKRLAAAETEDANA